MSRLLVAAVLLLTSFCVSSQAVTQPPPPPAPPPAPPLAPTPPIPPAPLAFAGDDVMMFLSPEFGGRSVVKGAPYAATVISETRQMLSDGNSIERKSTMKLYRDGQGRTRQEQSSGVVFINDVVAGKRYVLNTARKSAREVMGTPGLHVPPVPPVPPAPAEGAPPKPPPPSPPNLSADEARSWAEEMRRWAREFSERMRSEHGAGARDQRNAAEHVEVIRLHHADFDDLPKMALSPSLPMTMPAGPGTTSALGSRHFDGVPAQGTRTTWTIAAGRVGNKLPIEIASERWYSSELNVVVLSRHVDPRSGERIYRLEKIARDEPNAELFKVPTDFALKTTANPNPNPNPKPRDSERK